MPELARFYGIIIRMYLEAGAPHHLPHFHAYYGNNVAVYQIQPVEALSGELPRRQARLVEAWAELREAELLADWMRLQAGQRPLPIAPLNRDQFMKHPIHSVTAVALVAPYTLRIQFADETAQTINFEPVLRGELYGPLRDEAIFSQVRIDAEVRTLVWPNGADFDPATLHDWPTEGPALIAQASRWKTMEKAS